MVFEMILGIAQLLTRFRVQVESSWSMPQFSYKARRRSGEVVEGLLDVADRSAALIQIERLGLFPVTVDAAKAGAIAAAQRPAGTKVDWRSLLPPSVRNAVSQKRKPKLQELA